MQRIEAILDFIDTLPGFYDLSPYQRRLVLLERYLSLYLDFEPKDEQVLVNYSRPCLLKTIEQWHGISSGLTSTKPMRLRTRLVIL